MLGDVGVSVDGATIASTAWKSKKALEVLLWLAVARDGGAGREQVIEAIWPGRDPEKGRTLLRTALSEVRRVLEPDRHRGEPSRFVIVEGDRVQLVGTTDLTAGRSTDGLPAERFAVLEPGLAALGEADWVDELRRDVDRLRTEVAERVAGEPGPLQIAALGILRAAEPWSREHVDALMAAHRAAGDEAAARAVEREWFEDDD